MVNLIYMAKPRFGGWVTFTAHLSRKYNYKLYKIHTKTEKKKEDAKKSTFFGLLFNSKKEFVNLLN